MCHVFHILIWVRLLPPHCFARLQNSCTEWFIVFICFSCALPHFTLIESPTFPSELSVKNVFRFSAFSLSLYFLHKLKMHEMKVGRPPPNVSQAKGTEIDTTKKKKAALNQTIVLPTYWCQSPKVLNMKVNWLDLQNSGCNNISLSLAS